MLLPIQRGAGLHMHLWAALLGCTQQGSEVRSHTLDHHADSVRVTAQLRLTQLRPQVLCSSPANSKEPKGHLRPLQRHEAIHKWSQMGLPYNQNKLEDKTEIS